MTTTISRANAAFVHEHAVATAGSEPNAAFGGQGQGQGGEGAVRVVIVGGGPRTVSLVERLAASLDDLLGAAPVRIDVIDPHPVGGGRIWRREQSPLLWMNSVAQDVTVFTDDSVVCDGPIVPGPSLSEWVFGEGAERLERAGLTEHVRLLGDASGFASRAIQGEYLAWTWERVLESLPPRVTVTEHRDVAVEVNDVHPGGGHPRQWVVLAAGVRLEADVVVLAQGHLDRAPTATDEARSAAAQAHGLTYLAPGYTADVDLDDLQPGEPVIVSGFGLAFIDLMVLLGEGRGGRFVEEAGDSGTLHYEPSGLEPILHVGSRRGVPYHAKLGYIVPGGTPMAPVYLAADALPDGPLDFDTDVRPLIDKELTGAHYRRLFTAHSERVRGTWDEIEPILRRTTIGDPEFVSAIEAAVPDPADRFVIAAVDRPLAGADFADRAELTNALVDHIEADLRRRADPAHSGDLAVFNALLTVFGTLAELTAAGRISALDRVQRVESDVAGFFSFMASGPPPRRLRELLALQRAGVVHFLGPDLDVVVDVDHGDTDTPAGFVATSPAVPGTTRARAFVEARLPRPDVLAATDPVIKGLLDRGALAAENLVAPDGRHLGGGQLRADRLARAVQGDGSVHPRRFLLGPAVSGSAGSGGFARPGFNGPGFRQNDLVARHVLTLLADTATATANSTPRTSEPKGLTYAR